jgi:uncharacterized membrane-anchored protein YjiN (DUF445 family)
MALQAPRHTACTTLAPVNDAPPPAAIDLAANLRAMKRVALGLLLAAALLYALATAMEPRHAAWGYVAAFAEAAMVGAIADWFAVVALFRHPLGLPIPHTAIIPRNKSRIGRNLAGFICNHFLGTPQVMDKLTAFDPARRLADWLAEPRHAAQVGEHLASALRYALGAFDDERVRQFVRDAALSRLEKLDMAVIAGRVLDALTANRRHQALLDDVLVQVARRLDDEELQTHLADVIAAELKYLRYVGLDNVAGRMATRKIVSGVARLIAELGEDPAHPLRLRFDGFVAEVVERLQHDPNFRLKGEAMKDEVLAHPALASYLQSLWSELMAWLQADLVQPDSVLRRRVAEAAQSLGDRLRADTAMRQWINDQVFTAAPSWIERYREDIRHHIVARVDAWDTAELTRELELNIGRDLQFVRLNGTLVGGLIGLLIHSVTQAVRAL